MPDFGTYDPVLSGKATVYFAALPGRKQKQVLALIFRMAANPFQVGDYPSEDETGQRLENILVGEWHFTYWTDHSAREFRIVDLVEL
jgi:hypothetical protein